LASHSFPSAVQASPTPAAEAAETANSNKAAFIIKVSLLLLAVSAASAAGVGEACTADGNECDANLECNSDTN
jgi:hypothetical protein